MRRSFAYIVLVALPIISAGCASTLLQTAYDGDARAAAGLLAQGNVDVNARSGEWCLAPLGAAAKFGHEAVARVLLDHGADANVKGYCGGSSTPLDLAIDNGHEAVARLLIARGADVEHTRANLEEGASAGDSVARSELETLNRLTAEGSGGKLTASPAPAQAAVGRGESDAAPVSDVDKPSFHLPERPDDFALVVGVERYSNDLPDARYAERDARAVREHLAALGVPERNIKLLIGERASKANLEAYLEDWLPRNVKDDGRVFFYFSGHGAPDPSSGQAYLVPSDGNPNFLDKTAYPVKRLYAELGALKAKRVIVALDSCFSGAGGRSVLAEGARPLVTKVDADVASGSKVLLFAAAASDQITSILKDQGHGIFTYYLLKGLDGAAKNRSGEVTARGLYNYLKPKVEDAASRQDREQTPVLEGAAQDFRFE